MHYSATSKNMYAAVAYRALDNLLTGLLVLAGFSKLPQLAALVINTFLLAFTILLVWKEGAWAHTVSGATEPGEDRKDVFADKYRLTDREKEVLELLITKDEKGDDMAKELGVSRRGFVSLTSSIYRKTNTGSRVALLQKYMSEWDNRYMVRVRWNYEIICVIMVNISVGRWNFAQVSTRYRVKESKWLNGFVKWWLNIWKICSVYFLYRKFNDQG